MTASQLRRMATPLLDTPLIPLTTIEDLKARSRKRRRYHLASTSGAVVSGLVVVVLLAQVLPSGPSPHAREDSIGELHRQGRLCTGLRARTGRTARWWPNEYDVPPGATTPH